MGGRTTGHKMRSLCLEGQPLAALEEITGGINPHLDLPSKQVE